MEFPVVGGTTQSENKRQQARYEVRQTSRTRILSDSDFHVLFGQFKFAKLSSVYSSRYSKSPRIRRVLNWSDISEATHRK